MRKYKENSYSGDRVTVKPTDFYPQDVLAEYCVSELGMRTNGKNVSMSISELRDFYDWTEDFDEDDRLYWDGEAADYEVYEDGERVYDIMSLIYDSFEESYKPLKKVWRENTYSTDRFTIKATDFYPQDVLAEYCSDELDFDTDGRNVKLSLRELRDFYDWTQEFDDDGKIIWDGDDADYKVYENGEQIYDIMSLVYDTEF